MNYELLTTLALAAVTVGSLHSLAPDHWAPFAALARARGWSASRTAKVTLLCGFGHVTVSALLGLVGLFIGVEVIGSLGRRMESIAGILLVVFGLAYCAWGLRRAAGQKLHGHTHSHYDHIHGDRSTAWSLFLLFSADPCVAVLPLLVAAAPLGAVGVGSIIAVYEAATIGTMVLLVLPARAGVRLVKIEWLTRYEHAAAGAFIVVVGVVVGLLGI